MLCKRMMILAIRSIAAPAIRIEPSLRCHVTGNTSALNLFKRVWIEKALVVKASLIYQNTAHASVTRWRTRAFRSPQVRVPKNSVHASGFTLCSRMVHTAVTPGTSRCEGEPDAIRPAPTPPPSRMHMPAALSAWAVRCSAGLGHRARKAEVVPVGQAEPLEDLASAAASCTAQTSDPQPLCQPRPQRPIDMQSNLG